MVKRILSNDYLVVILAIIDLVLGLVFYGIGHPGWGNVVLGFGAFAGVSPFFVGMVREMMRGNFGVDILAVTAIVAALMLGEYLAAVVILIMLTGGEALENYAQGRARKELSDLLSRAPKLAHRYDGKVVKDVPAENVQANDRLLIKPGETVPVDAVILEGSSSFDESAITGESLPVDKKVGQEILSGSINSTRPVTVRALRTSADSQYQQIVDLVQQASASRSPMVRLADLYSVPFTLASFGIAGVAWAISGNPVRFLEVLVVATPCPLLIATPVAIVSGMSRAAKHGIIVKNGEALERLARLRSVAFDKTGTLTMGRPSVHEIKPSGRLGEAELLDLLATVEHASNHILAQAVVAAAEERRIKLGQATGIEEEPGNGVVAMVGGQKVVAGRADWLAAHGVEVPSGIDGQTVTFIAVDGQYAGLVIFADQLRQETTSTLAHLKKLGLGKTLMLTGDHAGVAGRIASEVHIADVRADLKPVDKVEAIKGLAPDWRPVAMVGDGVNDAPTLAVAEVGIALGARGSTAASESADVVIMLDDLGRVPRAIEIARRAIYIARQSIFVGIGLSIVLMIVAATGAIRPIYGALIQELIDVIVILNALRAHRGTF